MNNQTAIAVGGCADGEIVRGHYDHATVHRPARITMEMFTAHAPDALGATVAIEASHYRLLPLKFTDEANRQRTWYVWVTADIRSGADLIDWLIRGYRPAAITESGA